MASGCALLLLAACDRSAAPGTESRLVIALENAPTHLDPRVGSDVSSGRAYELMLSGLVKKDVDGNFVPDLATSWEVLDEGSRYRFTLRPGVRFHDGRPLSSQDVAWTFNSLLDGTVTSPKRGGFPQLERVEAVDELTVDFLLSEPYGALVTSLNSWVGIVPDGVMPDEFNKNPIGSGPYRFVERTPDRVEFAAFSDYWGEKPLLEHVVLREVPDATVRALELRKGSVHLLVNAVPPDVVTKFQDDPEFRVQVDPGSTYQYLGLNLEDPHLSDIRVRQALAHAIDRGRIIENLYQGLGIATETAIRPGHWSHHKNLEPIAHDPQIARALLDEAGYPDPDGEGAQKRLQLTYKTSTDETAVLQAQIIQAMLAEVGIDLVIRSFEFATFYNDVKQGNFQIFSLRWKGIVDPDIYNLILHSNSIPPAGANRGRFRNARFDELVAAGSRIAKSEERLPFYLEAQEIVHRELPYISLMISSNVAIMPCQLDGYLNYPTGEFYGIPSIKWNPDSTHCRDAS